MIAVEGKWLYCRGEARVAVWIGGEVFIYCFFCERSLRENSCGLGFNGLGNLFLKRITFEGSHMRDSLRSGMLCHGV